jgi:ATP-binding cassette, subfamily F, member 3
LLSERGTRAHERRKGNGAGTNAGLGREDQRRAAAERRAELAPMKKAMQAAEQILERLSTDLARLDEALADPALYQDSARAQRLSIERGQLSKRLGEAEEAWLSATEAYEQAAAAEGVSGA